MWRILLFVFCAWLIFLALCVAAFNRAAAATRHHTQPLAIAQTAWKDNPCNGFMSIQWTEALAPGHVAEATGIRVREDGSWYRIGCVISISPSYYHRASYGEKLAIVLHEAGHLAHGPAHHRTPGWIMSEDHGGCRPFCKVFPHGEYTP